ncbi:MAG: hypothetical protein AAF682_11675 [Planctomycetota bacterium]
MLSVRHLVLSSLLLGSLLPGVASAEDGIPTPPWGRLVSGLTDKTTLGSGLELEVVWTAFVGDPTSNILDLSTEVLVEVGGYSETKTVRVLVDPGAGVCSDQGYGMPCGSGSVDDQDVELICLADGQGDGYCQLPWITTTFPVVPESMFTPGDPIKVTLIPATGSQPELDTTDDFVSATSGDPIFYDRFFSSVELEPVPGTPNTYDIVVEYQVAYNTPLPPIDLRTDIVMEQNGEAKVFETWCGPWLLDPSSTCGSACFGQSCATIICGGQTVAKLSCQSVENDWGQFPCVCASEPIQYRIPSVQLSADGPILLSLEAPAGAMPDPEGLDQDEWILCSNEALELPYGNGKAGTAGVPTLDSIAPPIPGQMVGLQMKEALPGADPFLLVGFDRLDVPFDGGTLLVDPVLVLPLSTSVAPDGTLTLEWLAGPDPSQCGVAVSYQVMFLDPGAGGALNLAMTNGVTHVFGW